MDNKSKHFSEPVEVDFVETITTNGQLAISTPLDPQTVTKNHPVLFFHGATVPTQFTSEYQMVPLSWTGIKYPSVRKQGRSSRFGATIEVTIPPPGTPSRARMRRSIRPSAIAIMKPGPCRTVVNSLIDIENAAIRTAKPAVYTSGLNV